MTELRIKFERDDEVKYFSHLDILKLFERAIRRADIGVAYTKGFNPHPIIIFGLPMGVGLSSLCEFVDITFEGVVDPQDFIDSINISLPEGFRVTEAKIKLTKGNIMAQLEAAAYQVIVSLGDKSQADLAIEKHNEFITRDIIMVEKDTKKGKRYVDIRPLILESKMLNYQLQDKFKCIEYFDIEYLKSKYLFEINMLLSSSQENYLKPEGFIRAFVESTGFQFKAFKIKRMASYASSSGNLLSPFDDKILLQPG